jgi:small subunit ribosomal protein S1
MNRETLSNQDSTDQEVVEQAVADQEVNEPEELEEEFTQDDLEAYLEGGKYDYQLPKRGDIREGIIIELSDHGALVSAGFKRDGVVQAEDLDRLDEETLDSLEVGATIPVSVFNPHDEDGRLVLSIYQALVQEDWRKAEQMMEDGEVFEGKVSGYNRGGLLVPFGRIRGFVPGSHIVGMPRGLKGEDRLQRLSEIVGEKKGLKIIEVDRHRRRLIFSEREARQAWQKMQRKRVMEDLTEGETVEGEVTGITDFGAFVDLGGADGLVHISELSWKQVDDPREVVEVGDEVEVYILDLDWKRKRIALSLKRLQPNPWTQVDDHYQVGQIVEGRVTRVLDFGAFVELDLGVEGLLHVSEMCGTSELSPSEILSEGDRVLTKIINIDSYKERITLSARQVHRDEWESWTIEHKIAPQDSKSETETEVEAEKTAIEEEAAEPSEEDAPETQTPAAKKDESEEATSASSEADAEDQAESPEPEVEKTEETTDTEEAEAKE